MKIMIKIQNKRILIVEDSLDLQALLKMLLESEGYIVHCTSNGEEALSLLRKSKKKPDLILCDLRMPVMGGLEFREFQKANRAFKHIPVVFLSGAADQELHDKTDCQVLRKPVDISRFMEVVDREINSSLPLLKKPWFFPHLSFR